MSNRAFTYYKRLRRLARFVSKNYDQPISLAAAAGVVGLERTYFSKFFHAKTGVCFRDWLAHVRVSKAKELFQASNLTVSQAAHSVGFSDLGTFERTFKKCTGRTPRDYKREVRPGV